MRWGNDLQRPHNPPALRPGPSTHTTPRRAQGCPWAVMSSSAASHPPGETTSILRTERWGCSTPAPSQSGKSSGRRPPPQPYSTRAMGLPCALSRTAWRLRDAFSCRCVRCMLRSALSRCAPPLHSPLPPFALYFQRGQSVAPIAQAGIHGVCWRPQWNRDASGGGGGGSSTLAGAGRVELTDGALAAALVAAALGGAAVALLSAVLAQRVGCRLPVRSRASPGDAPLLPAVQRKQSRLAPSDDTVF